jgi:Zn ribbon nucleic-acid-binding protein
MIVVVFWEKFTATVNGRVMKLVPCENCSTEYVYVLEREGTGVGTSVYLLNPGAEDHAVSAAQDTLQQALENDFDAVPCPKCGHYQRYMFPKLLEERSGWGAAAVVMALAVGVLAAVAGVYWTLAYAGRPNDAALGRMATAWAVVAAAGLVGAGLSAARRARERRFDPNAGDPQSRIEEGRRRAVTRTEFEASQRQAST